MTISLNISRTSFFLLFFLIGLSPLCATVETYMNFVALKGAITDPITFSVTDDKLGTREWETIESINSTKSRVVFAINEESLNMPPTKAQTYTIYMEVTAWSSLTEFTTEDISLSLFYDPAAKSGTDYQVYWENNRDHIHKLELRLTSITSDGTLTFPDFNVSAELIINRSYVFDCGTAPDFENEDETLPAISYSSTSRTVSATWETIIGAEEYDLEWTFYDAEGNIGLDAANVGGISYTIDDLFENNATRITTDLNTYTLNALYPAGYLFFRVRAVRYLSDGIRETGAWSSGEVNTPISAFRDKVYVTWFEDHLNWQASTVYAEEGKKKSAVNYFDGSLYNRQSITTLGDKKIISQTLYDHYGRPVIQTLPAPSSEVNSALIYEPLFMRRHGLAQVAYGKDEYTLTEPGNSPAQVGELGGLGRYYGDAPFFEQEGKDNFIPDAEGYPFSMTQYTADQTGRILRQSGVGETFKMGGGRETQYFYGKPAQEQLDRLFGNDVGYYEHYLKNLVVDPNGQVSVSYIDAHGRTIATALAGKSPQDEVEALDPNDYENQEETNLVFNLLNNLEPSLVSTYTLLIDNEGEEYTIDYNLEASNYQPDCLDDDICYDCIYDVEITISDGDCNAFNDGEPLTIPASNYTLTNPVQVDLDCTTLGISESRMKSLPIGSYEITKVLTINESALAEYTAHYLEQIACLPTYEEILEDYIDEIPATDCTTTTDECLLAIGSEEDYLIQFASDLGVETLSEDFTTLAQNEYADLVEDCEGLSAPNTCEIYLNVLLSDMTPTLVPSNAPTDENDCLLGGLAGQYALYNFDEDGNVVAADQVSILHSDSPFYYADIDFSPHEIEIDGVNYAPNELTPNQFVANFDLAWAEVLVLLHPEYCHYTFCQMEMASVAFDDILRETHSFSDALALDELSSPQIDVPFDIEDFVDNDPFFTEVDIDGTCRDTMISWLSHINPEDLDSPSVLDWVSQIIYGYGAEGCTTYFGEGQIGENNRAWQMFRGYYLGLKEKLRLEKQASLGCPPVLPNCSPLTFLLTTNACFDPDSNNEAEVELSVSNFYNVQGFDFEIEYDVTKVSLSAIENIPDNALDFTITDNNNDGIIEVSWSSNDGLQSLGTDTHLATLVFTPTNGDNTTTADITFVNPIAYDEDNSTISLETVDGSIECTIALMSAAGNCPCEKVYRFTDPIDFTTPPDLISLLELADEAEMALEEAGASTCAAMREVWRNRLENSCASISNIESILDRLEAVCALGVDAAHPFGASTTPFNADGSRMLTMYGDDAFADILNTANGVSGCADFNPYLINYPGPYEIVTYDGPQTIISKANTCACDQLKMLESCYDPSDDQYPSLAAFLAQYSDVNLSEEEYQMLRDACTVMDENDRARYLATPIKLPPYLDCGVCKTCDDMQPLLNAANATYQNTLNGWDYQVFLTDYLNYHLAFNLEYEDYRQFNIECGGGALTCRDAIMICPSTPFELEIDNAEIYSDCYAEAVAAAEIQAQLTHAYLLEEAEENFINDYLVYCQQNAQETFTATGDFHEYHYTLYYYDQAGNLARTIPPKGVKPIVGEAELAAVVNHRENNGAVAEYPNHQMATNYQYNSLRQLVAKKMPDVEEVRYWYDKLGRMIASQDGRQHDLGGFYSYTLYDVLGRVIEVGEVSYIDITEILGSNIDIQVDYVVFEEAVIEVPNFNKKFVTRTYYDNAPEPQLPVFGANGQENLRNRVVATTFSEVASDNTYDYATHYSYDVTGNVKTMVQELGGLVGTGHEFKRIDYEYDFLSGNVHAVYYQKGKADQFTHRYTYDSDNRITAVYTSPVNTDEPFDDSLWERDANYDYYDHGPLARTELGQHNVQGLDYAYTIQGWIKGVNSSVLDPEHDMGRDGTMTNLPGAVGDNPNASVARDAFAYTLGYFSDDYQPIGGEDARFELQVVNTDFDNNASLYNGNIRHMVSESWGLGGGASGAHYTYDQLHRIKTMDTYVDPQDGSYSWGSNLTERGFNTNYNYDPNGNLQSLQRFADGGILMDDLTYRYEGYDFNNPDATVYTDRLRFVTDLVTNNDTQFPDDFEGQGFNNYVYDGAGNITHDAQSNADMTWNPYGKVEQIIFSDRSQNTLFDYGPDQNRVSKTYLDLETNVVNTTYYIRDAQGNCMAVYEVVGSNDVQWKEQHLYGSSRLGLWRPDVALPHDEITNGDPYFEDMTLQEGLKSYELSNHLGNVTATISDRKTFVDEDNDFVIDYWEPVVHSASEYYPFGLTMPGRETNFGDYRFGFNGKEADTKSEWGNLTHYDYGFRIYNPAIARFLSVDPLAPDYPWYTPYQFAGNMPIWAIDMDGLEPDYTNDGNGQYLNSGGEPLQEGDLETAEDCQTGICTNWTWYNEVGWTANEGSLIVEVTAAATGNDSGQDSPPVETTSRASGDSPKDGFARAISVLPEALGYAKDRFVETVTEKVNLYLQVGVRNKGKFQIGGEYTKVYSGFNLSSVDGWSRLGFEDSYYTQKWEAGFGESRIYVPKDGEIQERILVNMEEFHPVPSAFVTRLRKLTGLKVNLQADLGFTVDPSGGRMPLRHLGGRLKGDKTFGKWNVEFVIGLRLQE